MRYLKQIHLFLIYIHEHERNVERIVPDFDEQFNSWLSLSFVIFLLPYKRRNDRHITLLLMNKFGTRSIVSSDKFDIFSFT